MCDTVTALPLPLDKEDSRMEDSEVIHEAPPEIKPVVRQSSAGSLFMSAPGSYSSNEPCTSPFLKLQRVDSFSAPSVLHLKSLLGPSIAIPATSVQTVADVQAVATGIYGIVPSQQRIFVGGTELTASATVADLVRCASMSAIDDLSVRIVLALPSSTDSDANMGAFQCLPAEIVVSILSLLPVTDVCSVGRTCKRLREVSSDCKLWWTLYSRYWCPYTGGGKCTWKEIYKSKLESLTMHTCEEQRVRECIRSLMDIQSKRALALSPHSRASPMNLGLLDDCARRAIQFGAPAYNRRDFEACYRVYFSVTRFLVSKYEDFPRTTALFRKGIGYLRNSIAMAKNAQDDSRRAWSLRHGLDSILLMISSHRAATKSLLNLGEEYCARHMWAEAEASINEALDMSYEGLPVSEVPSGCDNLACHNYIFFMYIHCLLMQGKYVPIIMLMKDGILRGSLCRLKLSCFRHTLHFVEKGISAIDACLTCPHITVCDMQKLSVIKLYYVFVGAPTAEQLAHARHFCDHMRRLSTLSCLNSLVLYFNDKLEQIQPLSLNVRARTLAAAEEESGDEDEHVV